MPKCIGRATQLCRNKTKTMATQKTKFTNILDTEMFGDERQQYYFDIKKAKNERHFLQITNRKLDADETYKRTHIILFEDDLAFFVEAITMLLRRHATGHLGVSC
jgi:DNA repair protein RadC